MPGLLDIANLPPTVTVSGGAAVEVTGVSVKGIAVLLNRFPAFREIFTGRVPELSAEMLIDLIPDAIAAIIAAGTGTPGDQRAEEIAARLSATDQIELVRVILSQTMPKGVGPFVESLTALAGVMGVEPSSIPVTN